MLRLVIERVLFIAQLHLTTIQPQQIGSIWFDQLDPVQLLLHKSTHEVTRNSEIAKQLVQPRRTFAIRGLERRDVEPVGGADIQHVKGMAYRRRSRSSRMIRAERPRQGMLKVLLGATAAMTLTAPAPAPA